MSEKELTIQEMLQWLERQGVWDAKWLKNFCLDEEIEHIYRMESGTGNF